MLDCTTVRPKMDALVHGELSASEAAACSRHVQDCETCAAALAEAEALRAALRSMPVPALRAGFAAEALATARRQAGIGAARSQQAAVSAPARNRLRHRDSWSWWGGLAAAMAAGVVLATLWGLPRSMLSEPEVSATPPLRLALHEPQEITIAIDTEQAMPGARLTVRVDGGIELVGFGATRELSWEADLEQGTNVLALPVLAYSLGQGRLTALVEHEARSQQIELLLQAEGTTPAQDTSGEQR
jgi:hypothetical protein